MGHTVLPRPGPIRSARAQSGPPTPFSRTVLRARSAGLGRGPAGLGPARRAAEAGALTSNPRPARTRPGPAG